MSPTNKRAEYQQLVRDRKACRLCEQAPINSSKKSESILINAANICRGNYDSDEIGAFTRWQRNLDSPIVVIGQDFADKENFVKYKGWPGRDVPTNKTLVEMLTSSVEPEISLPFEGKSENAFFFTNAVLCMKSGGMQSAVPAKYFKNCESFLRKTIDIVSPKLVITLGVRALEATKAACNCEDRRKLSECVGQVIDLNEEMKLIPMYHPSPTVLRTHRKESQMKRDWRAVSKELRR